MSNNAHVQSIEESKQKMLDAVSPNKNRATSKRRMIGGQSLERPQGVSTTSVNDKISNNLSAKRGSVGPDKQKRSKKEKA